MTTQSAPQPVDPLIGRVADRQYGLITFRQLLDCGLSPTGINERVRTNRLRRIHRGV